VDPTAASFPTKVQLVHWVSPTLLDTTYFYWLLLQVLASFLPPSPTAARCRAAAVRRRRRNRRNRLARGSRRRSCRACRCAWSLASVLGVDVRTFEVKFSARFGEHMAPGKLFCGYCAVFHDRSSFSAQQCDAGHGGRYCLAFSQRDLPRHHARPSPEACHGLWNAGLSEYGKRLLAASNGDGDQARALHRPRSLSALAAPCAAGGACVARPSLKQTGQPERARRTLCRRRFRSRADGTRRRRTGRSAQLARR
jgi:hypothetical protein